MLLLFLSKIKYPNPKLSKQEKVVSYISRMYRSFWRSLEEWQKKLGVPISNEHKDIVDFYHVGKLFIACLNPVSWKLLVVLDQEA